MVGDEKPLHFFGRMRRPPPDDADLAARRGGDVPDRGYRARISGNRDLAPGLRIDLLEIEHAVHVGCDSCRRRRPEDRRDQWKEAFEARPVPFLREALPVRHASLGGEPVEKLPVEAVEADPDHRCAPARCALLARGDIRGFDRGQGRRRGRRLRPGDRRALAAPAADAGEADEDQKQRQRARQAHRQDHSKPRLTPSAQGVRLRGPNGGCSSAG